MSLVMSWLKRRKSKRRSAAFFDGTDNADESAAAIKPALLTFDSSTGLYSSSSVDNEPQKIYYYCNGSSSSLKKNGYKIAVGPEKQRDNHHYHSTADSTVVGSLPNSSSAIIVQRNIRRDKDLKNGQHISSINSDNNNNIITVGYSNPLSAAAFAGRRPSANNVAKIQALRVVSSLGSDCGSAINSTTSSTSDYSANNMTDSEEASGEETKRASAERQKTYDELERALRLLADDFQPLVARSTPKNYDYHRGSSAESTSIKSSSDDGRNHGDHKSIQHCIYEQPVYDHMIENSLKAVQMLKNNLDCLVTQVQSSSHGK